MTDELMALAERVEAVALAMLNGKRAREGWPPLDQIEPGFIDGDEWRLEAADAIAAYRPLIAAECAKVAEDEAARCLEAHESLGDDAKADWFAKHREAVLIAEVERLREAISEAKNMADTGSSFTDCPDCVSTKGFLSAALSAALVARAPDYAAAKAKSDIDDLREALWNATALIGHVVPMDATAMVAGEALVARDVWNAGRSILGAANAH
jgi:hypothetical protein